VSGLQTPRGAWVEVDLGAVERNVRALRRLTGPKTRFMAVVKADAYGHGLERVAVAATRGGAHRFGVATVAEALRLRESGVTAPIHLLSEPPVESAPVIVEHEIVPTVFSGTFAKALASAAVAGGVTARFHLKVETGMNRIGVPAEEAAEAADALRGVPGISMEGVYTHFATADVPGDWDFDRQVERFEGALAAMRDRGIDPGIVHAANSPATILHPATHYAMVRCGIAIYGLHPAPATEGRVDLEPAMSVKALVTRVRRLALGEGVSYGLTYRAAGPTTIATLPLGYADGVHRAASNAMRVLIAGKPCRQVGRVCMDQLMVEVPRGLDVSVGDEAVIVGGGGSTRIPLEELASASGTINYEIACSFGLRMERLYR